MTAHIQFGVALRNFTTSAQEPDMGEILRFAGLAEQLGLDSVYVWDHLLLGSRNPFPVLDSLITLAAVAAVTKRVRLGTGALVLPLRNPVVLAKQTATIDRMSQGRLSLGVAAGWYEKEFDAAGIEHARRGALFVENLELLYRLWSGALLNGQDPPYQFKNAIMLPPPVQQPRPEVLIGGYVDAALRRVGKYADGWLSYLYAPDSFARTWGRVGELAVESGRDPATLANVNELPICVADTFEEADRSIKTFLAANTDLPAWSECSYKSAIRGTPEQCAAQVEEYIEAGVQRFVFIPYEYRVDQLTLIATEVIPKVRAGS